MRIFLLFSLVVAYLTPLYAQQSVQAGKVERTITLFDGRTLDGWAPINPDDAKYWRAQDSLIIGGDGVNNVPYNTYLRTVDEYGDFELRCLFRLSGDHGTGDRKSTRLNSSHVKISYAVFCLKKKKVKKT